MSVFDKPLPLLPIDRTAKVVTGQGEHWSPVKLLELNESNAMIAPPQSIPRPDRLPDYSGIRRGRMVAIRFHRQSSGRSSGSRKGAIWIVRCDCGLFELRSIERWVKRADRDDCCTICDGRRAVVDTKYAGLSDKPRSVYGLQSTES